MSQLIPTPYTVVHIPRDLNKSGSKDSHGNYQIVASAPVVRKVQSIGQFGRRGSSRQVQSTEVSDRVETTLQMAVPNPDVYHSDDRVIIDPQLDGSGSYVPGTGIAYLVDGEPFDERTGPWPRYLKLFGGVVKLRRVT